MLQNLIQLIIKSIMSKVNLVIDEIKQVKGNFNKLVPLDLQSKSETEWDSLVNSIVQQEVDRLNPPPALQQPAASTFVTPTGLTLVVPGAVGKLTVYQELSGGYILQDETGRTFPVAVHIPTMNSDD